MNYHDRIARLRRELDAAGHAAALVFSYENRRYLTGFTGSNAQVWVTAQRVVLLTDGRYQTQAEAEAVCDDVVIYDRLSDGLKPLVDAAGGTAAFESEAITVGSWRELQTKIGGQWTAERELFANLRVAKEPEELAAIRDAVAIAERAFAEVGPTIGPGRRERDVALELEWAIRRQGAQRVPFEFIVASGPRSALPHGVASDRVMAAGDPLTLDFGAEARGYFSDMTFAGTVGGRDAWLEEIVGVLSEAQAAALKACAPGAPARDLDAAARAVVERAGYGEAFKHSLGHGVGLLVHEAPRLSKLSEDTLQPGMVVTIEPGIYVAGRGGARIEDMVVVTADGAELLTTRPKEACEFAGPPVAEEAHQ